MASLRKKARSPFWFACITMPDGRRVQRSTKETLRKPAQAKADEWERLSKERAKARQAHRVIAEIYKASHQEDLPDATVADFVKRWLERRKGEVSPASLDSYKATTSIFIQWLGDKCKRPLADLDTRQFVLFRDAQAARVSPATCNKFIKQLRVVFEDARRDGYIAENPAKDCPRLKVVSAERRRPFTIEELKEVLKVATDEWRSLILFGFYTGQRLGDLAVLSWNNIDIGAGEIHLRTAKTARMVRIPICGPLMEHIESLSAVDEPSEHLHPKAAKAFLKGNSPMVSRQFGDLLAAAGVTDRRMHGKSSGKGRAAARVTSDLSFHSLRHTATSLLKNAGVSPAVVQDIIGHDSAEMNTHYTHIELNTKRKALETLPCLTSLH
jgi:integrase